MGTSKETFSKKEKEKKRQKKRKDKEEKKEERKANAVKGQSLEDMFAYVDEHGNISSTPPDPKKKGVIRAEDIQIVVSKQVDLPPQETIRKGVIQFFNDSKGYGFIKDLETQEKVFVHVSGLIDAVKEEDTVTFEVEMTERGKNAVDVRRTS